MNLTRPAAGPTIRIYTNFIQQHESTARPNLSYRARFQSLGDVLYTDIDTVWLRDPIPHLRTAEAGTEALPDVDMWLQIDEEVTKRNQNAVLALVLFGSLLQIYTGFTRLRAYHRQF